MFWHDTLRAILTDSTAGSAILCLGCPSSHGRLLNAKIVYPLSVEGEAAFERGFSLVWQRIQHTVGGPTQIDETGHKCSGYKGQMPPRDGLSRGGICPL